MKSIWACTDCGHSQTKWAGLCLGCQGWNTLIQETKIIDKKERFTTNEVREKPVPITEIKSENIYRQKTLLEDFDRLLGGGVVKGSLILVGGAPGIGKSTLMLQIASAFAKQGLVVLYVCGEESKEQTCLRANRLSIGHNKLYLLSETLYSAIAAHVEQLKPDILIIDSIQIIYKSDIPSSPGSIVQVREVATEFMYLSKRKNISTFLIGHVTKSGEIAGPKLLEHLVDTVLEFEGDKQHGFRLLRSIKNRFGPTDDIAIFQMKEKGLEEVKNPSKAFLEERVDSITGSVIVPALEGVRPFLIEVQALVSGSCFSTPSRKCSGLDQNRLALLIAILEKRVGYQLQNCDVFVSLAGGVKIKEPGLDLGVVIAIASSFSTRVIDQNTLVVGEVGLGGEVRAVSRIESRIKEAVLMGCSRCILPKRNLKEILADHGKQIELIGVEVVDEAIRAVL